MPTPAKLNAMRQKRTNCIGNIKALESDIDQYQQAEELDVCLARKYQTQLEEEWRWFRLVHDEVTEHSEEDTTVEQEAARAYLALGARLERLILAEQRSTPSTASALQGKAADCLNALPLNNLNYSQALTVLKDSFECPRYTAFSHCMSMLDYPKLTNESPTELRRLAHTIKQHICALNKMGQVNPDNSALLNCIILSKVPLSIQKQWEMTLSDHEVPQYSHLLKFLEKLAWSSRPIPTVQQPRASPEQTIWTRQRAPRVTPACPTCQGQHPVWRCDSFKAKTVSKRLMDATRASLCLNCLKKGHIARDCHAGSCRICGGRHHTLLHPEKQPSRSNFSTSSRSPSSSSRRTASPPSPAAITHLIPSQPIDRSALNIPRNIKLADPRFHVPSPIDVLLSSGTTLSSMCVGQINLTRPDEPELRLQKTRFGWVIGGSPTSSTATSTFHTSTTALQVDLARFWEIDERPPIKHISEAERRCEDHFRAHTRRTSEGRYIVALPFNEKFPSLGSSKALAMKRLASLNRRFQRDRRFEADYRAVIQDYLDRGHMSKISPDSADEGAYYLPHHAVIKAASETTKLRVVFDGSAASSTGVSLNDTLYTGSKLQEGLFNILLRFRLHQYVLTGEIEKMYRQFLLSAAPYLALRCLKQLADDEGHRFPRASSALRRDFYVDDALTGADTKEEVLSLRKKLTELLQSAGLNIREWASNDQSILQRLSEQDKSRRLQLGEYQTLKTLGIFWDSKDDAILYSVEANAKTSRVTKRSISSVIARIYDPLGLLAPVIVRAKIILQRV
ncbi:uncharacterized protein LOC117240065 [Bombus vosnesenskii]|uniref:Uncharacterized protein LOC117240065 n=1 Tax=Bombus vosnesenskii TaxID=207650 RepID=A0A6J3L862_9HYME|nr:uncharacterized protein LOC117240065 [Bombus vosnesenskii]